MEVLSVLIVAKPCPAARGGRYRGRHDRTGRGPDCALRRGAGRGQGTLFSDLAVAVRGEFPRTLLAGQVLSQGSALRSDDGRFPLRQQHDGNLAIRRDPDDAPVWDTGTWGH